jgi:hypothetical protein
MADKDLKAELEHLTAGQSTADDMLSRSHADAWTALPLARCAVGELPLATWRAVLETNLTGIFLTCK